MQTFEFPSKSSPGTVYEAKIADDGKLLCNCRGWTAKRNGQPRHCTHTKKVAEGKHTEIRGDFVHIVGPAANGKSPKPAPAPKPKAQTEAWSERCTPEPPPPPMLASAMTDEVTGEAFDARYLSPAWVMEEKLDGHRVQVMVTADQQVFAWSRPRAGDTPRPRSLSEPIEVGMRSLPPGIYDGELVAPGGVATDVVVIGAALRFVIFDLLAVLGQPMIEKPWHERRAALRLVDEWIRSRSLTAIGVVEMLEPSWANVEAIWKRGGEGAVLKQIRSPYQPGYRSAAWVKVKQRHAAVLTLTGFKDGKSGPYSTLIGVDDDGQEAKCKTLNNADLRAIAADPDGYIGRRFTIHYQQRQTSGAYRHPMFDHWL